jgi:DMSO/TMAO reductase YedYZ molybdopterin-dependent catalytic subunit
MSGRKSLVKAGIIVVALLLVAIVAIYLIKTQFFVSQPGVEAVKALELRSYNGTSLSSIGDFRENSIKGPQHVDIGNYTLLVDGKVSAPRSYNYSEIVDDHPHYRKVVTLNCVEGWSVTILWDGIRVRDLLDDVGYDPEAKTIIFYAADGYYTSFPLSYILDNDIMLAFAMNNVTLPPERGYPFQLVAEGKWGYKWIKWVTHIEVSASPLLSGYWESRGYSASGDLNRSFLA